MEGSVFCEQHEIVKENGIPRNQMSKLKKHTVAASRAVMNRLVMPEDSNTLGTLMGGVLMHWMDMCAAISARRHSNSYAMTVTVDRIQFVSSIQLGEVVNIESEVTRAFRSSMEVGIRVIAENLKTGKKRLCTSTYYSFVAVDTDGKSITVPEIIPETDEQKKRFRDAEKRREERLEDARRMQNMTKEFDSNR